MGPGITLRWRWCWRRPVTWGERFVYFSRIRTTRITVSTVTLATRIIVEARYENDTNEGLLSLSVNEIMLLRYRVMPEDVGPEITIGKNQKYTDVVLIPVIASWT